MRYSQSILGPLLRTQPGVIEFYISNYEDRTSYLLDTTGLMLSGLTMSGITAQQAFYPTKQNQQIATISDIATINVSNGQGVSKPTVTVQLVGMTTTILSIYNSALSGQKFIVVAQMMAGPDQINDYWYVLGVKNGLNCTTAQITSGAAADSICGLTLTLEGFERNSLYQLTTSLASSFVSTYVVGGVA